MWWSRFLIICIQSRMGKGNINERPQRSFSFPLSFIYKLILGFLSICLVHQSWILIAWILIAVGWTNRPKNQQRRLLMLISRKFRSTYSRLSYAQHRENALYKISVAGRKERMVTGRERKPGAVSPYKCKKNLEPESVPLIHFSCQFLSCF